MTCKNPNCLCTPAFKHDCPESCLPPPVERYWAVTDGNNILLSSCSILKGDALLYAYENGYTIKKDGVGWKLTGVEIRHVKNGPAPPEAKED